MTYPSVLDKAKLGLTKVGPDIRTLELKQELCRAQLQDWLREDIHLWTRWLNLALMLFPWILWWRIVDKKRLLEILVLGLLVSLTSTFLDVLGSEFVFWDYPDKLIPNIPRLVPVDYAVLPVSYMIIYQYFPKWKQFTIANTILALVYSFVAEPILLSGWTSTH